MGTGSRTDGVATARCSCSCTGSPAARRPGSRPWRCWPTGIPWSRPISSVTGTRRSLPATIHWATSPTGRATCSPCWASSGPPWSGSRSGAVWPCSSPTSSPITASAWCWSTREVSGATSTSHSAWSPCLRPSTCCRSSSPLLSRAWGDRVARFAEQVGLRNVPAMEVWRSYRSLTDREQRQAFVRTMRSVIDPGGQSVSAMDRLYLAEHIPTLIVWGERDRIIPVAHAYEALKAAPHSRLEVLPGVGHFPQSEDPETFVALLEDFIETTPPSAATAEDQRRLLRGRPRGGPGGTDEATDQIPSGAATGSGGRDTRDLRVATRVGVGSPTVDRERDRNGPPKAKGLRTLETRRRLAHAAKRGQTTPSWRSADGGGHQSTGRRRCCVVDARPGPQPAVAHHRRGDFRPGGGIRRGARQDPDAVSSAPALPLRGGARTAPVPAASVAGGGILRRSRSPPPRTGCPPRGHPCRARPGSGHGPARLRPGPPAVGGTPGRRDGGRQGGAHPPGPPRRDRWGGRSPGGGEHDGQGPGRHPARSHRDARSGSGS